MPQCRPAFLAFTLLAAACVRGTAPAAPPPAPPPNPPTSAPEAPPLERLTVCVVRNGVLTDVPVSYDRATGDSLYEGRRLREAFPIDSSFAASAAWYRRHENFSYNGRPYWAVGLPRAMRPGELVVRGKSRGLMVFVTPGTPRRVNMLYLAVRPTCEFQQYETESGPIELRKAPARR
jgi:hypothetical protein